MWIITDVPKDILEKLDKEINKKYLTQHNHHLAGNIKKELAIPEAKQHILNFLAFVIEKHKEKFGTYKEYAKIFTREVPELELNSMWVNFQKKHEFNPLHIHGGLYSFVLWHKIPYLIEDEIKQFPDIKEGLCKAGCFGFVYTDQMGDIVTEDLPVDKTWEGKIAVFPAKLNHIVYPFYTSDDYRITISGNVSFK